MCINNVFCLSAGRSRKRPRCQREDLYPLVETEECPCDTFLSQPFGNWSSCILPEIASANSRHSWQARRDARECGQGLRYRAVACMDHGDHLVSPDLCSESGMPMSPSHRHSHPPTHPSFTVLPAPLFLHELPECVAAGRQVISQSSKFPSGPPCHCK